MQEVAGAASDGRVARGERTRRQLAEALISLLEDGVADPTAREVSARAGVSLRLVFHHFDDMEQLLRAAVAVQAERHWRQLRPVDPSLPRDERVARVVRQREALFEAISPVRRAAARVEAGSPTVAAELLNSRLALRRALERVFAAELGVAGSERGELLDALEAATAWEVWDQLRRRMGLGQPSARRVIVRTVLSLLENA